MMMIYVYNCNEGFWSIFFFFCNHASIDLPLWHTFLYSFSINEEDPFSFSFYFDELPGKTVLFSSF